MTGGSVTAYPVLGGSEDFTASVGARLARLPSAGGQGWSCGRSHGLAGIKGLWQEVGISAAFMSHLVEGPPRIMLLCIRNSSPGLPLLTPVS